MRSAVDDLCILIADAVNRRPRGTAFWTVVVPPALALVHPLAAVLAAACGGALFAGMVDRRRWPPWPALLSFVALTALVIEFAHAESPAMEVAHFTLPLAFAGPVLARPSLPRSRVAILVLACASALTWTFAYAPFLRLFGSDLHLVGYYAVGVLLGVVSALRGRTWLATVLLGIAGLVLLWGNHDLGRSPVWTALFVSGVVLPAVLCARVGNVLSRSSSLEARVADALARTCRRVQVHPWITSLVATLIGLFVWVTLQSNGAGGYRPSDSFRITLKLLYSSLAHLTPPLLGAWLGHVLRYQHRSMDRLAPLAAIALVFSIGGLFIVPLLAGNWVSTPTFARLSAFALAPAAIASVVVLPRFARNFHWIGPALFALAALIAAAFPASRTSQFAAVLTIALACRMVLDGRATLIVVVLTMLTAAVLGDLLRDVLFPPEKLFFMRISFPWLLPSLVAACWPLLLLARKLGRACGVPNEHPIYADFGGPTVAQVPRGDVVSPEGAA